MSDDEINKVAEQIKAMTLVERLALQDKLSCLGICAECLADKRPSSRCWSCYESYYED